ncbi:MAG: hypothetical protein V7L04_06955 [Nostoc sp.]|uniref:hypothetical protein n=1 Tax=Nostoc sp. TaxID=1180 RepID=UPI002FF58918
MLESAEGEGELKDLSEKELAAVFGGVTGKHKIQPLYGVVSPSLSQIQAYGVVISDIPDFKNTK